MTLSDKWLGLYISNTDKTLQYKICGSKAVATRWVNEKFNADLGNGYPICNYVCKVRDLGTYIRNNSVWNGPKTNLIVQECSKLLEELKRM